MKITIMCILFGFISSCGIAPNNSTSGFKSLPNNECTYPPAGNFKFICTDLKSLLGEHAPNFEITISNGFMTIVNASENAKNGAFLSDTASFAPYKNRSGLNRSDCRFQTSPSTIEKEQRAKSHYTYKIPQELFAGSTSKVSIYDEGGERMNSTYLNCELKL